MENDISIVIYSTIKRLQENFKEGKSTETLRKGKFRPIQMEQAIWRELNTSKSTHSRILKEQSLHGLHYKQVQSFNRMR